MTRTIGGRSRVQDRAAEAPPLARLRHIVRSRIAEYPALYLPFARRKYPGPSPEVLGPHTELVIDGFTRSASTFAVYAFQLAQDQPVRLAHHLHAPAQLIAAARMGIPTMVPVREPRGAVLSQVIREPGVEMGSALVAYARFHECLLPFRSSFVIADFPDVTKRFGSVIRRLNDKFETSFSEFEHTEENTRECMELIKHRPTPIEAWRKTLLGFESGTVTKAELRQDQDRFGQESDSIPQAEAWIPSEERERKKSELNELWMHPKLTQRRKRAESSYDAFLHGHDFEWLASAQ